MEHRNQFIQCEYFFRKWHSSFFIFIFHLKIDLCFLYCHVTEQTEKWKVTFNSYSSSKVQLHYETISFTEARAITQFHGVHGSSWPLSNLLYIMLVCYAQKEVYFRFSEETTCFYKLIQLLRYILLFFFQAAFHTNLKFPLSPLLPQIQRKKKLWK